MFPGVNTDYYEVARKNEGIFRNILEDLKNNKSKRPMGLYIPEDLKTNLPIEDIFKIYSEGNRMGQFTIGDFSVYENMSKASISFYDIAILSGGGADLEYIVSGNKVKYNSCLGRVMS
jgi:hypothetical protein